MRCGGSGAEVHPGGRAPRQARRPAHRRHLLAHVGARADGRGAVLLPALRSRARRRADGGAASRRAVRARRERHDRQHGGGRRHRHGGLPGHRALRHLPGIRLRKVRRGHGQPGMHLLRVQARLREEEAHHPAPHDPLRPGIREPAGARHLQRQSPRAVLDGRHADAVRPRRRDRASARIAVDSVRGCRSAKHRSRLATEHTIAETVSLRGGTRDGDCGVAARASQARQVRGVVLRGGVRIPVRLA